MEAAVFLASVLAASPPILFTVLGETITERAGVVNLSLDGSLLLTALAGFVLAFHSGSVVVGVCAAMLVGALIALALAFVSLTLRQNQFAVGFVLTLLCRDLAYVLGNAYTHLPGPQVPHLAAPGLAGIPLLGRILFDHDWLVYLSLAATGAVWFFMFRSSCGLRLRGLGENPAASFARGANVVRLRYIYTLVGGAMVGLGGASFSLLVKPGWARPYGIEGTGWIALAIVIFGGWHPLRAAAGACFFVALQNAAIVLQSALPNVPTQVFAALPFPLMILTLLLVTLGSSDWAARLLGHAPPPLRRGLMRLLEALQASPPAALGTRFDDRV
jgi:simple sugar transport system permease protein